MRNVPELTKEQQLLRKITIEDTYSDTVVRYYNDRILRVYVVDVHHVARKENIVTPFRLLHFQQPGDAMAALGKIAEAGALGNSASDQAFPNAQLHQTHWGSKA